MRTASPVGSFRSQQGGRSRPRGRDVFDDEIMIDEGVQTSALLLPPPVSDTASMKDVEEISASPRRKRPGYFSAREEDLDPLEMDVDDFITPARKKQRTSISLHQGPKFAALWEPSRRENWPLGEREENPKIQEEKKDVEDRERIKEELKDLKSPAFKLPPSARKEINLMDFEQPSPTKPAEEDTGDLKFQFTNAPASPKADIDDFKFLSSNPPTSPQKSTENGIQPREFSFSKPPSSPTKTAEDNSVPKFQFPIPATSTNFFSPEKSVSKPMTAEEPKPNGSPSKTSTFMQSILSEKSPEEQMDDIPAASDKQTENGVKSPEIESQSSFFNFSSGPTQSTFGGLSQDNSKPAVNGGFDFGKDNAFSGFGESTLKAAPPFSSEESAKITNPPPEKPVFNFGQPTKAVEEPQSESAVEKPVETKPLQFNFGQPKTESTAVPPFGNVTEAPKKESPAFPVFSTNISSDPKKDSAPQFGTSSVLGPFGGAFNKSESETSKPIFGALAPSNSLFGSTSPGPSNASESNDNAEKPETAPPAAPVFGSGMSSGFNFGSSTVSTTTEHPRKEVTPPPIVPATAVPQELDDSMDITDSPPATRNASMTGDTPSQFPVFPTSAPTSAPSTTAEPSKPPFNFGQANGTAEKPTLPSFGFARTEEKKTGFTAPTFGSTVNPPFGSSSPAPTAPAFSGFGAFPKKDETPQDNQKPADKSYPFPVTTVPTFGASNPPESKPLFGSQTTAPIFGTNTSSLFGNTSAFPSNPQPSMTSPPTAATSAPFSFNFSAPTSNTPQPFGGSNSFFSQNNPPINNPFAPAPVASPAAFPGSSSAPVSPQNQQLPAFPGAQNQFSSQSAGLFGSTPSTATTNFPTFAQNLPAAPIFTLGAEMQRSSSDAGPTNGSPSSRKFAQPGRRRFNRRG